MGKVNMGASKASSKAAVMMKVKLERVKDRHVRGSFVLGAVVGVGFM